MARIGSDTPSYCSTSTLPLFWDDAHADAEVSGGRWTGASESAYLTRYHGIAGQSVFYIGDQIEIDAYPAADKLLYSMLAADGSVQVSLVLRTDGKLSIFKGVLAGVEIVRTLNPVPLNTVLDLGFEGTIDAIAGSVAAYVGIGGDASSWTLVLAATSVDTQGASGDSTWRGFTMGLTPDILREHCYYRDGRTTDGGVTGLSPGSRTGTRRPNAAGILTAWTPNTGTLQAALDDTDHDGDTTIGQSNGVAGTAFSVGLDAVASHARYYGISTMTLARNSTAFPSLSCASHIVTDADGSPVKHTGPSVPMTDGAWRPAWRHDSINPRTGALFTKAELDALEAGAETI